ncbi:MAG: phospholipase D-like domain-containing protein [Mucilaginibacter sp.]|uniref:phospholipase D-like domain-containing protein n=1 Tax=Mucilaginibacter sp. TaxID=1882438 RepID=UPI0031A9C56C
MPIEEEFQVSGTNDKALFTLKLHRGEGMLLIAMNWKTGEPSLDFVGFAIEYQEPGGDKFYALKNRLSFPGNTGMNANLKLSTRLSPIQKFRWVHFPRNAEMTGEFIYRVTPVFMNTLGELSYGDYQEAAIVLQRETYPGMLNVSFTRGFVASQAFVDNYEQYGPISTLLPSKAKLGLTFKPTHPKTAEALTWMGFEARSTLIEVLTKAVNDPKAKVDVVAYDLNVPDIVDLLEALGKKLRLIIDNDGAHGKKDSAEQQAEDRLKVSALEVKRQHMGQLQHNKTIIVDSPTLKLVACGSTNFAWRGFYVQNNNAIILTGKTPVKLFQAAFNQYWASDKAADFGATTAAQWQPLELKGIDARITFSPHAASNAALDSIGADIATTKSSLFYSMAFLSQITGPVRKALTDVTLNEHIFVYGISDKKAGGFDLLTPDGNFAPVSPGALSKDVPEPFKSEPTGGGGTRMHHKFVVIDFNLPTARVYMGSYNFSPTADNKNGENLLLIKNRKIAVSYMIEALRIFDHYEFRVAQKDAKKARKKLNLQPAPKKTGELPWWKEDYTDPIKIKDRLLFA